MTREESICRLIELKTNPGENDVEVAHLKADDVLVEVLNALGFQDVIAAWRDVPKWYA